jgi:hypothetical protein
MYESTTEEDLRGKEATVLPFQSFGALGMARTEDNDNRWHAANGREYIPPCALGRFVFPLFNTLV